MQPLDHPKHSDRLSWFESGYWGVGFLKPVELKHGWLGEASLPLYDAPGGDHLGWLSSGWVWRGRERAPMSPLGLVEISYELNALVLAEVRDDGWLGLRLTEAAPSEGGVLWTHRCRTDGGATRFEVVLWRDRLAGESVTMFRDREWHALRAQPSEGSERLSWIVEGDDMEILEVRGEWARVRVYQPGKFTTACAGGEWAGEVHTGWTRWWSDDEGTWIRFPTRGC